MSAVSSRLKGVSPGQLGCPEVKARVISIMNYSTRRFGYPLPEPIDLSPKVVELASWLVQQLNVVVPPAFSLELDGDVVGVLFDGQAEAGQGLDLHYAPETAKENLAHIAYQVMSTVQDVIVERTTELWPTSDVTQVRDLPLPELRWSGDTLHLAFVYGGQVVLELKPLRFTKS